MVALNIYAGRNGAEQFYNASDPNRNTNLPLGIVAAIDGSATVTQLANSSFQFDIQTFTKYVDNSISQDTVYL